MMVERVIVVRVLVGSYGGKSDSGESAGGE